MRFGSQPWLMACMLSPLQALFVSQRPWPSTLLSSSAKALLVGGLAS